MNVFFQHFRYVGNSMFDIHCMCFNAFEYFGNVKFKRWIPTKARLKTEATAYTGQ